MAKGKRGTFEDDPLASTAPEEKQAGRFNLDKAPTVATGLGVRTGELEALNTIAQELGITKNALMRLCLRYVITEHEAGRLDLRQFVRTPPSPKNEVQYPG